MGGFRHNFPTLVQQPCNMLVHRLHAWEQPLSIVFSRPIPFVRIRLYFHWQLLSASSGATHPEKWLDRPSEGTKSLPYCRRTDSEAQADVTDGLETCNLRHRAPVA